MIRIFCIAALLAAGAPACLAAQDGKSVCPDARTQHEMNVCAAQELARADRVLNERYPELVRTMPPVQLELLRTAQRAWIRFRDAECAYQASVFEGGSMQPMVRSSCLARLTEERAAELGEMLTEGA
ncbi:MAG TPA: lysozyme inhibitor LprI family protein [Longimicrobium sp.]|nr:lysozyme inhibitor LprI family protein [Longimicrobium sp.]